MRLSPAEVDERVSFFVCVKVGEGGGTHVYEGALLLRRWKPGRYAYP